MKTKIASLCLAAVFSILAFATNTSAAEEGFYDKEHIRGFISLGGDFRGMFPAFQDYVNTVPFASGALKHKHDTDTSVYYGYAKYSKFNKYYPGIHFNIGAQYKQFLTWFNINFMPTQISERPSDKYTISPESGSGPALKRDLYDVKCMFIMLNPIPTAGIKLKNASSPSVFQPNIQSTP